MTYFMKKTGPRVIHPRPQKGDHKFLLIKNNSYGNQISQIHIYLIARMVCILIIQYTPYVL